MGRGVKPKSGTVIPLSTGLKGVLEEGKVYQFDLHYLQDGEWVKTTLPARFEQGSIVVVD